MVVGVNFWLLSQNRLFWFSSFWLLYLAAFSYLQESRLLTLIEGVLAANIFDWGSRACVDLYHKGTIIEIYRMSRNKMQRPWRVGVTVFSFTMAQHSIHVNNFWVGLCLIQVDDFDIFKERMFGSAEKKAHPYKRALLFVDNAGADIVLGMLPLARELLRRGTEVGFIFRLIDENQF